jgi:hypothetical protein
MSATNFVENLNLEQNSKNMVVFVRCTEFSNREPPNLFDNGQFQTTT